MENLVFFFGIIGLLFQQQRRDFPVFLFCSLNSRLISPRKWKTSFFSLLLSMVILTPICQGFGCLHYPGWFRTKMKTFPFVQYPSIVILTKSAIISPFSYSPGWFCHKSVFRLDNSSNLTKSAYFFNYLLFFQKWEFFFHFSTLPYTDGFFGSILIV